MNSRDTFPVAEEAPSAMPSAMEWITRPIVVEELLELVARGGGEPGGGGGSSGESSAAEWAWEWEWWRKPWSEVASGILLSVIYADVLLLLPFAIVVLRACSSSAGRLSMRYMRTKPEMSASPMHVCGDRPGSGSAPWGRFFLPRLALV